MYSPIRWTHAAASPRLRTQLAYLFLVVPCLMLAAQSAARGAEPTATQPADWRQWLTRADPAFSQMPFWFWNDQLEDDEIRRQMADFREHGVHGFVIHARMGLPKTIPYMGERWLHHVQVAVEEAARTGMRVCLYDEGMYPSGSAHGAVVRANPQHASQGLTVAVQDVTGSRSIPFPKAEGRHIATLLGRRSSAPDTLEGDTIRVVPAGDQPVLIPPGDWRLMTFSQVPSRGKIRGVHENEEDNQPDAPAAADLLNAEAMRSFLELAYEPYFRKVGSHFGNTILAMFTDEPGLLGRAPRGGLRPWTTGFEDYFVRRRGYSLIPLLPALFFSCGDQTAKVRADFQRTLAERLNETYYAQLSAWCRNHKIALTGHPSGSDETWPLQHFQIPGQDLVWRYVVPGNKSALDGAHSTTGKCSSSVARHDGRARNADEVYGAYGWNLTLDEMKWLADWLIVRGVNLFYPHAFYYSVRDERAQERPPDLGPHNTWWAHYKLFADYTSRLCGLTAGGRQVCDVAVLSLDNSLPWRAATWLFTNQVDFNYLEDWRLGTQTRIENGTIHIAGMAYRTLIIDGDEPITPVLQARINAFEEGGGRVIRWQASTQDPRIPRDLRCSPPAPDLRCAHYARGNFDFYLLANEGEAPISTGIRIPVHGQAEWFDAWANTFEPARATVADEKGMTLPLMLERRASRVLCIRPGNPDVTASAAPAPLPVDSSIEGPWSVSRSDGTRVEVTLGNWLNQSPTTDYAGTLVYRTNLALTPEARQKYVLDVGRVGDWAVLAVNGKTLGPRFWPPYAWDVTEALRAGQNELSIEVTNSLAARYDAKNARPSGLFGPVELSATR